jgi:hypothetical protein
MRIFNRVETIQIQHECLNTLTYMHAFDKESIITDKKGVSTD